VARALTDVRHFRAITGLRPNDPFRDGHRWFGLAVSTVLPWEDSRRCDRAFGGVLMSKGWQW